MDKVILNVLATKTITTLSSVTFHPDDNEGYLLHLIPIV